jgi:hypothetical protein
MRQMPGGRSFPFFLFAAILSPSLHAAEADTLLHAVAARYASATDYTLRVSIRSSAGSSEFNLAASLPHHFMLREKSRTNGRFELLLTAGPSIAWGYQPHRKLYTKSGAEPGEERTELARIHYEYFGRFQHLDREATRAQVVGQGSVQSGGQTIRCLRVRIARSSDSATEDLWIDPIRHLVLRAVARRKRPFPETGAIVTTTVWHQCDLDHPVDPALFTFEPPPSARRTNTLEYR